MFGAINQMNADGRQNLDAAYARYKSLRESAPVLRMTSRRLRNTYLITRHDDVANALCDPRLSKVNASDEIIRESASESMRRLAEIVHGRRTMFRSDPPEHTRLRKIVGKSLIQRKVLKHEPFIRKTVRRFLSSIEPGIPVEIMSRVIQPLPVYISCKVLGFREEDRAVVAGWSKSLIPLFEGLGFIREPDRVLSAVVELDKYLTERIHYWRRSPGEALISDLVHAEHDSEKLTDEEIKATVMLILLAGNVTTSDFISNGLYRLLTYPEAYAALHREPNLLANAVEEMLRFDPPVQLSGYIAKEPLTVRAVRIPEGSYLNLSIASANRDPRMFENPDVFDIRRSIRRNLCFGGGVHMCVGAGLARIQGKIFFEELFATYKKLHLGPQGPQLRRSSTLRGFDEMSIYHQAGELSHSRPTIRTSKNSNYRFKN